MPMPNVSPSTHNATASPIPSWMWLVVFFSAFVARFQEAMAQNASAVDALSPPALQRLVAAWASQHKLLAEVKTARLAYAVSSRSASRKLSERELRDLWVDGKLSNRAQLDETAKFLDASLPLDQRGFSEAQFVASGACWRHAFGHSRGTDTWIHADGLEIWVQPYNRRIHVYRAADSNIRIDTLPDFRYVPSSGGKWDRCSVDVLPGNRAALTLSTERDSVRLVADLSTNMVLESRVAHSGPHGSEVTLMLQSAPFDSSNEVFFPKSLAKTRFVNDELAWFDFRVIDCVDLKAGSPESEFVTAVEKGTTLLDHRIEFRKPEITVIDRDVKDLSTLLAY